MFAKTLKDIRSLVSQFRIAEPRRRNLDSTFEGSSGNKIEQMEQRIVPATSVYGTFQMVIDPPGTPPAGDPGPYEFKIFRPVTETGKNGKVKVSETGGTAIINIPGEGGIFCENVKVNKNETKAKIKGDSNPLAALAKLFLSGEEVKAILKYKNSQSGDKGNYKMSQQ